MRITKSQALRVGNKLKVNWNKVDFSEFKFGMKVESEHIKTVGGSLTNVGKIVLDHFREDRNYYIKFRKSGLK